jgi:hypothetical protein
LLGQASHGVDPSEMLEHGIHLMINSLIYVLLNELFEVSLIHAFVKLVRTEIVENVLDWYL